LQPDCCIAKQDSSVKDRDFGIIFRQVMAVTLEKRVAAFKD